jgi:ABC-type lipoprotein release transport system permease subunit
MNRLANRYRNILDFAISSLSRRKWKNLSLLVIYTLIVFALASLILFVSAMKREAAVILKGAPSMVVQKMVMGRHDLMPLSYAAEIGAITGVEDVTPRLWGYYYDALMGANYTMMVSASLNDDPEDIIIGSGVARLYNLGEGDIMPFLAYDKSPLLLNVRRVMSYESELAAADLILMSEEGFRALYNFPAGYATDLALTISNPKEVSTIAAKIADRFPDTRPISRSEILRTYDAIFDWRGGMMIVMLSSAIFSFIIFAWDKATGLSAEERKEIGILKSIGWETADVLMLKFWEGVVISLSAFLMGVIFAYCHVFFLTAPLFEHALKGWAVLYPRFKLVPAINTYELAILFFLTVIPYTTATIIPSWRAATADPDTAMRS